jgi:hypothetical protein
VNLCFGRAVARFAGLAAIFFLLFFAFTLVAFVFRFAFAMTTSSTRNYSAASAAPPCAFDQPAGSPMNFST